MIPRLVCSVAGHVFGGANRTECKVEGSVVVLKIGRDCTRCNRTTLITRAELPLDLLRPMFMKAIAGAMPFFPVDTGPIARA